jgi:hypothetical protein
MTNSIVSFILNKSQYIQLFYILGLCCISAIYNKSFVYCAVSEVQNNAPTCYTEIIENSEQYHDSLRLYLSSLNSEQFEAAAKLQNYLYLSRNSDMTTLRDYYESNPSVYHTFTDIDTILKNKQATLLLDYSQPSTDSLILPKELLEEAYCYRFQIPNFTTSLDTILEFSGSSDLKQFIPLFKSLKLIEDLYIIEEDSIALSNKFFKEIPQYVFTNDQKAFLAALAQNTKNIPLSSYIAHLNILDDFKEDGIEIDFGVYDNNKASLLRTYLKVLLS